jgi:MFS family permease
MMIAALLDLIDASIVNTALPSIGRSLHASSAELEWTVSAYMLGFAATLIIAGHLGDRFGRKRLFLAGVACFALASAGSAIAYDPGQLIAARAV